MDERRVIAIMAGGASILTSLADAKRLRMSVEHQPDEVALELDLAIKESEASNDK